MVSDTFFQRKRAILYATPCYAKASFLLKGFLSFKKKKGKRPSREANAFQERKRAKRKQEGRLFYLLPTQVENKKERQESLGVTLRSIA